ncbi:MAG: hypothetical protein ACOYOI_08540 [Chthoniobacterales bacterium]
MSPKPRHYRAKNQSFPQRQRDFSPFHQQTAIKAPANVQTES